MGVRAVALCSAAMLLVGCARSDLTVDQDHAGAATCRSLIARHSLSTLPELPDSVFAAAARRIADDDPDHTVSAAQRLVRACRVAAADVGARYP